MTVSFLRHIASRAVLAHMADQYARRKAPAAGQGSLFADESEEKSLFGKPDAAPKKPAKKDDEEGGRWVTMHGTHVFIGSDDRIKKGPKHFVGLTAEEAEKTGNPESGESEGNKESLISFLNRTIDSQGRFIDEEGRHRSGDWFRDLLSKRGDSTEEQKKAIQWLRVHGTPAQQRWQLGEFNYDLRKQTPNPSEDDLKNILSAEERSRLPEHLQKITPAFPSEADKLKQMAEQKPPAEIPPMPAAASEPKPATTPDDDEPFTLQQPKKRTKAPTFGFNDNTKQGGLFDKGKKGELAGQELLFNSDAGDISNPKTMENKVKAQQPPEATESPKAEPAEAEQTDHESNVPKWFPQFIRKLSNDDLIVDIKREANTLIDQSRRDYHPENEKRKSQMALMQAEAQRRGLDVSHIPVELGGGNDPNSEFVEPTGSTSPDHQSLLDAAARYRDYGPGYNRHIATSASHLEEAVKRGHHKGMLDQFAKELDLRLKVHGRPEEPKERSEETGERSVSESPVQPKQVKGADLKFKTAGEAIKAGLPHAGWTQPISEAFVGEQIDDDHPAYKSISHEATPLNDYFAAQKVYGKHVRTWNGDFAKVTDVADDGKSVTVTHADGKTSSHVPRGLTDLEDEIAYRKKQGKDVSRQEEYMRAVSGGEASAAAPEAPAADPESSPEPAAAAHPFDKHHPRVKEDFDFATQRLAKNPNYNEFIMHEKHANPEFLPELLKHVKENHPDLFEQIQSRKGGLERKSALAKIAGGDQKKNDLTPAAKSSGNDAAAPAASTTPDDFPAAENPFRNEMDKLHQKADSLTPGGSAFDKSMASSFPLGVGRSGNASSRRTSAQAQKRIDKSVNDALKSIEVRKQANKLKSDAEAFDRGEIDQHGNRTELGKQRDAEILQEKQRKEQVVSDFKSDRDAWFKSTFQPGHEVALAENPSNTVKIQRVNKTGITSESGSKWKFDELVPLGDDKKPMDARAMIQKVKEWKSSQPPAESESAAPATSPTPDESPRSEKAVAKFDPEKHGGYKPLLQMAKDVDAGKMSVEEFKAAHKMLSENSAAFQADLKSRFNAQQLKNVAGNLGSYHAATAGKDGNAKYIYERLMEHVFDVGDGISRSYSMDEMRDPGTTLKRLAAHVEKQTAESLQKHIEGRAASVKADQEEADKRAAAIENPKDLVDFSRLEKHVGGYLGMKPEHQAAYDEMRAEKTRAARQEAKRPTTVSAEVSDNHGGFDLTKNFHSKRGQHIFTASPKNRVEREEYDRMNKAAKQLGGWYYKAFAGTPGGFHFPDEDKRDRFMKAMAGESVDRSDILGEKQQQREQTVGEKLAGHAERLEERASSSFNADRKENTSRRAGMAESARAKSAHEMNQAVRLRSISEAMANGEAKHLSGMSALTHLEALQSVWKDANRKHLEGELEKKYGDNWRRSATNSESENTWRGSLTPDSIAHAQMPRQVIYPDNVSRFLTKAAETAGLKQETARWQKRFAKTASGESGEDRKVTLSKDESKEWFDFANRAKSKGVQHDWGGFGEKDTFQRLHAMGIHEDHELRAALRELAPHQEKRHGSSRKDPVAELEKKIHREHRESGFFPSPPRVVDRLMELADIQDGHSVLEPSAGSGRIMDAIKANHGDSVTMKGIEHHGALQELLQMKGHDIEHGDFLEHKGEYDRVIMNPPFENDQAVDHIKHAFSLLKPGGRLVAVIPGNERTYREASRKKRQELASMVDEHGGVFEELPEKSFAGTDAPRETGVNSSIVVLHKPGGSAERYSRTAGGSQIRREAAMTVNRYAMSPFMHGLMAAGGHALADAAFQPHSRNAGVRMINRLVKAAFSAWLAANMAGTPAAAATAASTPAAAPATATAGPQTPEQAPQSPTSPAQQAARPANATGQPAGKTGANQAQPGTTPAQPAVGQPSGNAGQAPAVSPTAAASFKAKWGLDLNALMAKSVENQKAADAGFAEQRQQVFGKFNKPKPPAAKTQTSGKEGTGDEGKWITIGGHPGPEGKHQGGTPVQVDGQGNILKGPDAIEGKDIDDLKNASQDRDPRPTSIEQPMEQTPEPPWAKSGNISMGGGTNVVDVDESQPLHQPRAEELATEPSPAAERPVDVPAAAEPAPAAEPASEPAAPEQPKPSPLDIRRQKAAERREAKEAERQTAFAPDDLEGDGKALDDVGEFSEPEPQIEDFDNEKEHKAALSKWNRRKGRHQATGSQRVAKSILPDVASEHEMTSEELQGILGGQLEQDLAHHQRHESAKSWLKKQYNMNSRRVDQWEDGGKDVSNMKDMDVYLSSWAGLYPEIAGSDESRWEEIAWDLMKQPQREVPGWTNEEWLRKTAEQYADMGYFQKVGQPAGAPQDDEPKFNDWGEAVPFSRTAIRMAVDRYVRRAMHAQRPLTFPGRNPA